MAPAAAPVSWLDSDMLLRVLALCATAHAQSVTGVWHAAVKLPNGDLAGFQLQLEQRGNAWSGALVNGPDREQSSSGTFDGRKLRLVFNHWDGVLEADFDGTKFTGVYTRTWRKEIRKREFVAQRQPLLTPQLPPAVDVSGEWTLEVTDAGKRSIWKAQFVQKGSRLEGILLPVSGVYYPISVLPHWMQVISWAMPPAYVFEGMRGVMLEGRMHLDLLLGASLLNLLYLGAGCAAFLLFFRSGRMTGKLLQIGE